MLEVVVVEKQFFLCEIVRCVLFVKGKRMVFPSCKLSIIAFPECKRGQRQINVNH